ncbi:MAG TPA: tetratricopeptide repeat protein, partial [Methanothrix sp.]|nr:tetratricopeptide repeat protein [Methanothrix sp.]
MPASDELPERADLPPGSLVPFRPNAVFTGRQEDLLNLAEDLLHSTVRAVGLTQAAAVATGYGGIGKTQLAVEFCYRYGRYFQGVHWISADLDIPAEISACGEAMGLSPWPNELPERVRATLNAWKDGQPRLVVLDNVTDQEAVSKWMPQMPRCRLLITSRQQDWPSDMDLKIRPVNVFSPDRSRELLIKLASRLNEEALADLDSIADRLGNLPLALDLAGRYLADRPGLKPKDYLKALDEEGNALDHSSLKDWVEHNPTEHATNLASTFALSWDRLSDDGADSLARRIFRICGYCAANTPIPVELLAKAAGTDESTEDMDRAMKRLSQLGMAILIDGRPVLHPLLAEFARMQDETEGVLPELADALIDLAAKADETGYPKQMEPLREHLEAVASIADRRNLQSASRLIGLLASHKRKTAEYDSARKLYKRALEIDEKANGPDHPSVAADVNNLGSVLQDLGDLQEARKCFERALEIDEKFYGKDHPEVATDVSNLGGVLRDLGDLQEARKCFERALEIDEKVYGRNHPDVARYVNNLGSVLQDLGDLQDARKCYERALEIDEKVY